MTNIIKAQIEALDLITNQIFQEASRYDADPRVVFERVREQFANKLACIEKSNPISRHDAMVAFGLANRVMHHEPVKCRCAFSGAWGITPPEPVKIIYSGNRTIVFWDDGSKTIVKCAEGQDFDEYNGFVAAYAKKMFRGTSRVKKLINKIKTVQEVKKDKYNPEIAQDSTDENI